jgi:glycosyltransferase involved in cell wall biosynthesis
MKTAIVYDRVNKWGGAERVLLALHELYPEAPLYTSLYDKKGAPWAKVFPEIKTSFLQKLSFLRKNHEFLAPFMPLAFRFMNLSEYDLVISVTSESAKNVWTGKKCLHLCYCLTPTRYLWSGYKEYFRNPILRIAASPFLPLLKRIDFGAAQNPKVLIAISKEVQKRIKTFYKRNSVLVFPPVEILKKTQKKPGKHYLLVSRLDYGYKKVELAIKVFNQINRPLVIVGRGREEAKLKKMAGTNIRFSGKVTEPELKKLYKNAIALVMPQEEDFGIVSVEAQSFGVPVVAYKKGGATDTVIDGKTGVLFKPQSEKGLTSAILRFEKMHFKADNLFTNAKKYSKENFKRNFAKIVQYEIQKLGI